MSPQDIAVLERESWFAELPAQRRAALIRKAGIYEAPAGARLYRLGDPPNGLHALLEGKVRMVSYSAGGLEMVAMVLRPGLWFGELSVIDGKERPHDAITDTPVRVAHLSMADIANLTSADPELWRDIALLSCEHQRMSLRYTARIQTQPATVRLAGFLLSSVASAPDAVVRLTQEDLAQVVGVSRQHINILLGQLKALGFVRTVYGGTEIRDLAALRRFVRTAAV